MKNVKENIPVVIQQIGNGLLDTTNRNYIRENYKMTLISIRNYCDELLGAFDKQQAKEQNKKRA
jgi:hypothetical protein